MDAQRVGATVFVAVGAVPLAIAAAMTWSSLAFLGRARPVTAVVVGIGGGPQADGVWQEHADADWIAADGSKHTARVIGRERGTYQVGQRLDFLYDPAHVDEGLKATNGFERWFPVGCLGVLGLGFVGVGARALARAARSRAAAPSR
jgi:hypothetical protein